jgi:isoaspartyl peptidase/L-asparaginase-like protein (Ntn-hydrolase superfamily)
MEVSVMDGEALQAGATALLSDVRNPMRVARVIMEKTVEKYFWRKRKQKAWVFFELLEKTTTSDE